MPRNTHIVLDLVYTEQEGQECYEGTHEECQEFVTSQGPSTFTYKIVPIIKSS